LCKIFNEQDSQYEQLLQIGRIEWGVVLSEIVNSARREGVPVQWKQFRDTPSEGQHGAGQPTLVQLAHEASPWKVRHQPL
jgi:hypothetical protein